MENKENQPTSIDANVNDLNPFILGGLEPTEVQFEEGHEILLEEIDFFKDKVEIFKSLEDYADKTQYPSIGTLIDKTDNKKQYPQTFFQKHGYPSAKTQMTDLDKEMLKKA